MGGWTTRPTQRYLAECGSVGGARDGVPREATSGVRKRAEGQNGISMRAKDDWRNGTTHHG